ncbi:MAG: (d)CMP kinase [Candidatus Eisenbacteria bacterium]|nr:(d)CMP kinase [Candidatus Eisenbacteria bacterium]
MSFVVAIDGPSAAGKSTTARAVAERLGFLYLDTGAFYRALALKALREGAHADDAERLGALAASTRIEFTGTPSAAHVFLEGEDVSEAIRTPEVSEMASRVAAVPQVRRQLVLWQRALRDKGPLVGEGRDLGTVVFPDAEVKVYLDADLDTRAQRRCRELHSRGIAVTLQEVREDLARRDERDRTRADSPLRAAEGARVVDTSGMELEQQVKAVLDLVTGRPDCPGGPGTG